MAFKTKGDGFVRLTKDDVDLEKFAGEFLEEYLKEGFTSLPKKEIDLLVLTLLLKLKRSWKEKRPAAFELAKQLGVKRGRILSMLDDLSYRQADEDKALEELARILKQSEIVGASANQVKFQIEDGSVRECAKQIIRDGYGVVDTSFDRTVITLSPDKFLFLASKFADEETRELLLDKLEEQKDKFGNPEKESLVQEFARSFVVGAGNEMGRKTVKLGFALLSGGLSEVSDLVSSFFS